MHNPASVSKNETQTSMGFWHKKGSLYLGQTNSPSNNQQQQQKRELAKQWALLSQLIIE